ncbi:MAG: hypothetical protein NTU47_18355 [Ignavibacteriales bacterium]|nr:hypothetical protein [Ignavibacteriales bacterium]
MSTRHNTIPLLWIIASMALHLPAFSTAFAQNNFELGGLAGAAMRMGFGARGMGMANSLTAIKTDDGTGYYNPAVVPFQAHPSALLSAGFLPFDRNLNFVSYAQSIKPTGGFSLALINAGVSKIQGRSLDGLPTETYSTSENEFLFTFGTKVRPDFAVGVSAKILYYSLFESVKSTTVGFDLGIVYAPSEAWTIGAVVADINSKYKWDTSQLYGSSGNTSIDRFPLRRKLAICYSPGFLKGRIAGEVEWVGAIVLSRIGAELALQENVTLRGGIDQIDFAGGISSKPSIGFSLQTAVASLKPTIDYGFILEPYGTGGIHMLSLRLSFE